MKNRIVIIDGNSLINRAYYAMQRPMITKDGLYTQGVYGFLNMLNKIKNDYEPEYISVAFDMKAPTFRHEEYKEYKAGRKKMPSELAMQIPVLKEVLDAMKIKRLEIEGFEADDIIGTIAKEAEQNGLEPLIITGDKDELQLATDKTKVIITKRGISDFELYDKDAMIEKYGFTPEQFIDYKGLMGDQSDNIPGLPGVGEKTAKKLILQFGSMENLIQNTDSITPDKLREKIQDNIQLAVMSKRLATINTQVPIEASFEEFRFREPDYDKLIEIYTKLQFNRFLKKLDRNDQVQQASESISLAESKSVSLDFSKVKKRIIKEAAALEHLELSGQVAVKVLGDNNHIGLPKIYGICIMSDKRVFTYINCEEEGVLKKAVKVFNEKAPRIIGHDLGRDYYMLMAWGLSNCYTVFDTAVGQYVLESNRSTYDIKTLAYEYFHEAIESEKDFFKEGNQMDLFTEPADSYSEYGLKWCGIVLGLKSIMEESIAEQDLKRVYYEVELPLIEVMAAMELTGITVNREELLCQGAEISTRIDEIKALVHQLAGEQFNLNSPAQLGLILFEKLGLPVGKKTKTGYSTDAETLERIKEKHEIVPLILEYRMLTKLNGTYIEGLLPLIDHTGKIHAHFKQTVAATGRLSCTEPNLQNIPIRQEYGRRVRKAFVPQSKDYLLVGADYSQIELRILAHMSGDTKLIESFNKGEDIHKATAANVLGLPENEISIEQRSRAKAVNFGVIYGMSAFGLSSELQIGRKEADEYINTYFEKHQAVKEFMDKQVGLCKEQGYVSTLLGRRRMINEITAANYGVRQLGERLAMNSPIQGSAADIIKLAMLKVYHEIKRKGLKSKLILQVHDELIIEAHKEELGVIEQILAENMESAMELKVKLAVDLNNADNWYDLK